MKTRTIGETIQCLYQTTLPIDFHESEIYKSLVSAALTLATYPNEYAYTHFQKCVWKTYGYLQCKVEFKRINAKGEGQIRIFLSRLDEHFA